MSRSPSKSAPASSNPDPATDHNNLAAPMPPTPQVTKQPSRARTVWLGGHFDPTVAHALKTLALQEGTTVQALIGRALNDLLEKHRLGRPASETVLPRGGAAHRRISTKS